MAVYGDSVPLQHSSDLARGLTRPVKDLPVGEPDCRTAVDGSIEIAFEIGITPNRGIVMGLAVELDDELVAVLGIAVADTDGRRGPLLPRGPRQTVRSLDANEIAVLKNRAGAVGDVDQHRA